MEARKTQQERLQAVVIGSGFGGAVTCCRLAQKWPSQVLLLERGRRYPKGSFPRSPHDFAGNFWVPPANADGPVSGPGPGLPNGLFDVRNFSKMDAVVAAGYGGGSLIYANVFLQPPDWVFEQGWPNAIDNTLLAPYFAVARAVLGAQPVPPWHAQPERRILRTELFERFAKAEKRESALADICVFFGNDYARRGPSGAAPLALGQQQTNRYGATQTSCTYCGECDVGCNVHAKNSLDLNYLFAAEHWHGAQIRTECQAEKIVPLNASGEEDSAADGAHGYRVYFRDAHGLSQHVDTLRVIVAAGTLGTNELLLRCRDEFGVLPRLSRQLGQRFSGNGDFVSLVAQGKQAADPNFGPVITRYVDYGYMKGSAGKPAFLLEDAAYPAFAAWYVEGLRPLLNPWFVFPRLGRALKVFWRRLTGWGDKSRRSGAVGEYFKGLLQGDMSYRSSLLLCMGKDHGDGVLSLKEGQLALDWPQQSSRPLYDAIIACGRRFKSFVQAASYVVQPTWRWPLRNNVTVHPLGGCALAATPAQGVASADEQARGQLFGYQGLYVADGSLIPGSLGANPSATIAALSEWIAQGITGLTPDDNLGAPQHD